MQAVQHVARQPARPAETTSRAGGTATSAVPGAGLLAGGYDFSRTPVHAEREADRMADEVVRTSGHASARAAMESRFGVDLSRVRVHTGTAAAAAATSAGARAYTLGHDIVFGAGQFNPGTTEGNRLFAHELAHVVQQANGLAPAIQRKPLPPGDEKDDKEAVDQPPIPEGAVVQDGIIPAVADGVPPDGDDGLVAQGGPVSAGAQQVAAPRARVGFVDAGRTATVRWGDVPVDGNCRCPHAFTSNGRTGAVTWGPAGAKGNQNAGSIQGEVVPSYDGADPVPPAQAQAWVVNGTGTIQVTRSYVGVNAGNQGNGYFLTAAGAARIEQHEQGHIAKSQGFHDADLKPMLDQVLGHTQAQAGRGAGADKAAAITALKGILKMPGAWNTSKTNFTTHDTAENRPGGAWDTAELASGTYIIDRGPGNVAGTAYTHRITTPTEPVPAP